VTTAHILWHVREDDPYKEDAKLIGVYSSDAAARAAIGRVQDQPGFCDFVAGFEISDYEVDKDHWAGGFVRA
jgi:hypothetical protein